jgi:hypothetical protein
MPKYLIIGLLVAFARSLMPFADSWISKKPWLSTALFFVALAAAIALLFSGCASTTQLDQTQVYQHNLKVTINGQVFNGIGIAQAAPQYHIKVQPEGKIDRIILRTCHRELVYDKPSHDFWDIFKQSSTFETDIVRDDKIESVAACAMEIDVYEQLKHRSGWALIDFQDARPEISLPMYVRCNGEAKWENGVGVCQSAAGLTQEVSFNEPVLAESGDCPGIVGTELKPAWLIAMPAGKCTIYFAAKTKHQNGQRLKARLNTLGYTAIPPVD